MASSVLISIRTTALTGLLASLVFASVARAQSENPFPPARGGESLLVPEIGWWEAKVSRQVLDKPRWVTFNLETVLLDALASSPRIQSVSHQTAATLDRVVEEDAAFDTTTLLGGDLSASNDPVGNTLTTGGAPRLREQSLDFRAGARRLTRRGTEVEVSQEVGFLDSNSTFFLPVNQGNARLSLNLTKPLLSRGGRYYNERLVTQARIEGSAAWQELRTEVEQRIADVINAYWRLTQMRAQLTQQRELLERSRQIEAILASRKDFDAGRIEIAKARQRVARRADEVIRLETDVSQQQARLAVLIGNEALFGTDEGLELIPTDTAEVSDTQWSLRDAVGQALVHRPEIRAATHELRLAALQVRISRVELEPQLNAVFNGYLSQLNGGSRIAKSFIEQFENAPSVSAGLEYELPNGRRASRSRSRQALQRYKERQQNLREVVLRTQFEVETALTDVERYAKQRESKRRVLATAIDEENILTVRWRLIGGDGSRVGVVLETLLDAQQRRTTAEQDLVAVESDYMVSLVQLNRAMGTLLISGGIHPQQSCVGGDIHFLRGESIGTHAAPHVAPQEIPLDASLEVLPEPPVELPPTEVIGAYNAGLELTPIQSTASSQPPRASQPVNREVGVPASLASTRPSTPTNSVPRSALQNAFKLKLGSPTVREPNSIGPTPSAPTPAFLPGSVSSAPYPTERGTQ
ncbi:MAG: TolC family protein [Planctomycetota bacterium]